MDASAFEQVYGAFQDFHAYFGPLFGLTLSNPSQATLDDTTATGAIENGESSSGTQEDPPVVLLTAAFITGDGWFAYNLAANLAQVQG